MPLFLIWLFCDVHIRNQFCHHYELGLLIYIAISYTYVLCVDSHNHIPYILIFLSTYLSSGDVALRINTTIYCINFYFLKQYIVYKSFSATAPYFIEKI